MFDIGWAELLVLASLALIVVGPKDLPRMLRTLGRYSAQARAMARDFQRSMEDAAREADVGDMKEMRELSAHLRELRDLPKRAVADIGKPVTPPARPAAPSGAEPVASEGTPPPPVGETTDEAPSRRAQG